jgi:glycosyltransferase involved in cell wall biosynthesis
VVIATYNYGRYLAGAIDSVLTQTYQDYEIIVVDDGSYDHTREVIKPFLADRRIEYCVTDHVGQPRAKNAGIRLARGPLIAILDADDIWLPSKLERQVALFDADAQLGVAYTRRLLIDEEGRHLPYTQPPLHRGDVLDAIFRDNFICHSSVLVRSEVFDRVGLFDESIPMAIDYDLWLRVALHFRFDYVDEPLVKYRTGHANLSQREEERLGIARQIMRRFLDEYGGRERVAPAVVRQSWAETYFHTGYHAQRRSRLAAIPWYLRAIAQSPSHGDPWRGLISIALPRAVYSYLRGAAGRAGRTPLLGHPGPRVCSRPLNPVSAGSGLDGLHPTSTTSDTPASCTYKSATP